MGAEGHGQTIVDRCTNAETWKEVKGFCDGSFKDNGKSGCGTVIKGVDRDRWVTISRTALPLKVGTANASEVTGVCMLTEILDLVLTKCLSIQNINRCVDKILGKQ